MNIPNPFKKDDQATRSNEDKGIISTVIEKTSNTIQGAKELIFGSEDDKWAQQDFVRRPDIALAELQYNDDSKCSES